MMRMCKRIAAMLLVALLLCGCTAKQSVENASTTTAATTTVLSTVATSGTMTAETTTTTAATTTTTVATVKSTTSTTKKKTAVTTGVRTDEIRQMERELFTLINEQRVKNGLEPYTLAEKYYDCVAVRAAEASVNWSHTRPDGTNFWTVLEEFDLMPYGGAVNENLGRKFVTAQSVVDTWMKSDGHRKNILSEQFEQTCIAVISTGDGMYCAAQLFVRQTM